MAVYYQSSPPATPQPAEDWIRSTDGAWFIRNIAGTAWRYLGNINDDRLGGLPRSGASFPGSVKGPSGLLDSGVMKAQLAAKSKGIELATVANLSAAKFDALYAASSKIAESFLGFNGGTSAKRKVAVDRGVFTQKADGDSFTIPLPPYLDGSGDYADESDCVWVAGIQRVQIDVLGSSRASVAIVESGTPRTYGVSFAGDFITAGCRVDVAWMIVGVRS